MNIEEAILEKVRALPPKEREEVLEFASSLSAPAMGGPLRNPEGPWAGFDFTSVVADTHAALWYLRRDSRLPVVARDALRAGV